MGTEHRALFLVAAASYLAVASASGMTETQLIQTASLQTVPTLSLDKFAFAHNLAAYSFWWCRFDSVNPSHWRMNSGRPAHWGTWVQSSEVWIRFDVETPRVSATSQLQVSAMSRGSLGGEVEADHAEPPNPPDEQQAFQNFQGGVFEQDKDIVTIRESTGAPPGTVFGFVASGHIDLANGSLSGTFNQNPPAKRQGSGNAGVVTGTPSNQGKFSCNFLGYAPKHRR
jgi:hypothetical protein